MSFFNLNVDSAAPPSNIYQNVGNKPIVPINKQSNVKSTCTVQDFKMNVKALIKSCGEIDNNKLPINLLFKTKKVDWL
jgi:hypothetical protein